MEPIHYRELPSNTEGIIIKTLYLEAELQGRGLTLKEFEGLGHDKKAVRKFIKAGFLQAPGYVQVKATGQRLRVHRFNIKPLKWHEKIYWRSAKWVTAQKMTLSKLFLRKHSLSSPTTTKARV